MVKKNITPNNIKEIMANGECPICNGPMNATEYIVFGYCEKCANVKDEEIVKHITKACCVECGKKLEPNAKIEGGITVHMAECPYCHKRRFLIPVSDWYGYGD